MGTRSASVAVTITQKVLKRTIIQPPKFSFFGEISFMLLNITSFSPDKPKVESEITLLTLGQEHGTVLLAT